MPREDEEFLRNLKEQALRKALSGIETAHHTPGALSVIDKRAKELLDEIKKKCSTVSKPKSLEESINVPESPGHVEFTDTASNDSAVIKFAFAKTELPERFYSPLVGGYKYLEHIPNCPYCLSLVFSDENEFLELLGIDISDSDISNEFLSQGFKKKKGGTRGDTFKGDIDFPKTQ